MRFNILAIGSTCLLSMSCGGASTISSADASKVRNNDAGASKIEENGPVNRKCGQKPT
jgi:hypothetical protein